MLVRKLIDLAKKAPQSEVIDIRVGLFYTAVMLDDGRCGVAATSRVLVTPRKRGAEDLRFKPSHEMLELLMSPDPVLSAIGMATLNAVISPQGDVVEGDLLELIEVNPEDTVGMIGYFGPFVEKLTGRVKKLYVFERGDRIEHVYPDWSEPLILPKCDIVIITGTTFVNKTIDYVLESARNARKIAIAGPTTPVHPFLLNYVHILSGIEILDGKKVVEIVSQGGGTKAIMEVARKINLAR